ncbi:MAG: hypothetical protein IJJ58_03770, partial [Campylobacter sp.]|nr:hypothetical protein [Campylobacter sp.]
MEKYFPKWKYEPLPNVSSAFEYIKINHNSTGQNIQEGILPVKISEEKLLSPFEDEYNEALQKALKQADKIGWHPEKIEEFFVKNKDLVKNAIEVIGV